MSVSVRSCVSLPHRARALAIARPFLFTLALPLAGGALSCSDRRAAPAVERATLGGEAAARVGSDVIPTALVAAVASAQQVSSSQALERLVDDAVAAEGARRLGRDREQPASWRLRAARARVVIDRLLAEARTKGPPTDAEIKTISDAHWQEVDRPPSARTVHVVVMAAPTDPPEKKAQARELAAKLRESMLTASSADDFVAKAKAFPHPPDVKVQAEALPPVTDEGWVPDGPGNMSVPFSKAANGLAKVGDTSGVVESEFGFHVIRLVERVPERRMPIEARRLAFVEEALSRRAQAEKDTLVKELLRRSPVSIEPAAEGLMRGVSSPKDRGTSP